MKMDKMKKHLDDAFEKQVPDVWGSIEKQLQQSEVSERNERDFAVYQMSPKPKRRNPLVKRLSVVAAVVLVSVGVLAFTPMFATLQGFIDKIFSSEHIDDSGVRTALEQGLGQTLNQTYYDEEHDITVHFEGLMTDDKETKLLLTYESDTTDLEHYYLDLFEGVTAIYLISEDGTRQELHNVGWGSRHFDSGENKVVEALSFESIESYDGQSIQLQIEDITIYDERLTSSVEATWPLEFTLDSSAILDRETVEVNKEFTFDSETYTIERVEFSELETRVVVTGSDIEVLFEEGVGEYRVMSKLEQQFLNAREIHDDYGYIVDYDKSGVFLTSGGEKADPIFSKGEVEGADNEFIMFFAPVKDREDCVLEVGDEIRVLLTE